MAKMVVAEKPGESSTATRSGSYTTKKPLSATPPASSSRSIDQSYVSSYSIDHAKDEVSSQSLRRTDAADNPLPHLYLRQLESARAFLRILDQTATDEVDKVGRPFVLVGEFGRRTRGDEQRRLHWRKAGERRLSLGEFDGGDAQ